MTPGVSGGVGLHQTGVEDIVEEPLAYPILYQDIAAGDGALIVGIKGAAAVPQCAIVYYGALLRSDFFLHFIGIEGGLFADEVTFKAVSNCLVDQHTTPPIGDDDGHLSCGGFSGIQHGYCLTRCLFAQVGWTNSFEHFVSGTLAQALRAHLPHIIAHRQCRNSQAEQGLLVVYQPPLGVGDNQILYLIRIANGYLFDRRVKSAGSLIGCLHEQHFLLLYHLLHTDLDYDVLLHAALGKIGDGWLYSGSGNVSRSTGGLLQFLHGEVIGVRVADLLTCDNPNTNPLADAVVEALYQVLFQRELGRNPVLHIYIGKVSPFGKGNI